MKKTDFCSVKLKGQICQKIPRIYDECWSMLKMLDSQIFWILLCAVSLLVFYFLLLLITGKSVHGVTKTYEGKQRLFGKTVIITGGNSGIGKETCLDLADRGARIIMASTKKIKSEEAIKEIKDKTGNYDIHYMFLDLSDLDSVRQFAEQIVQSEPRVDILINNAGLTRLTDVLPGKHAKQRFETSKQGYEYVFATNYLGPFLLTYLLLDVLKSSAPSRIINVASMVHVFCRTFNFETEIENGIKYPRLSGYCASKLANIMHARSLAKRLTGTGVTANSLHPGFIKSDIYFPLMDRIPRLLQFFLRTYINFAALDAKQGAQTTIFLAVDEGVQSVSGKYFDKQRERDCSHKAKDENVCEKLWQVSMEMCGLTENVCRQTGC